MCRAMARSDGTLVTLNEKIKRFQRLKALDIEIGTYRSRFAELTKRGETLVSLGGELMKKAIALLVFKWNELENEAKELASELEEAKDLLEFSAEFDNIEEWFKEKELMLCSGERGTNYEHCVALFRKAGEAQSGVYEARIENLLLKEEKLVKQGRTDKAMVAEKTSILVMRSNAIKLAIVDYRKALLAAIELHAFNRDFDDLHERIKHKAGLLGSRRNCQQSKPDCNALQGTLGKAKVKLDAALNLQSFLGEVRELSAWINDMHNRIQVNSDINTLSEAETHYNLHQERKRL